MRSRAVLLACLLLGARPVVADGLTFPRDHHAHDDAREEWWTLLAHVRDDTGRWLAVQGSFHRFTWTAEDAGAAWPLGVLFPAVVAVSDLEARTVHVAHRVERRGPGTIEYDPDPLTLRHRAWMIAESDSTWRLEARVDSIDVALTFRPTWAAAVLWSRAETDSTPETHRYVLPHVTVSGRVAGAVVTGVGWLDHAWGDPVLVGKETGWEILTAHMRDGAALVVYRARSVTHQVERRSGGVYVSATGTRVSLDELTPRLYPVGGIRWSSEDTGITYPRRWRVEVPALDLDVTIEPSFPDQELPIAATHGASLWRGGVEVSGKRGAQRITGAGFLEVVGYGGRFPPALAEKGD